MHSPTLLSTLTAVLVTLPLSEAGLYSKTSPVLQINHKNYESLIARSNHSSIVEFYAPWCGHCKNLQPAYEKAAKNLEGLAKVAAVDCDEEANKAFCGSMGVQGFPTLKTVRPSKKAGGKPVIEDYNGARTASAITDTLVSKMNNHVVKLSEGELMNFLNRDGVRGILFTEKSTTSALMKSLAIDYLDVISIGQLKVTQKDIAAKLGVESFPTFVVLPDKTSPPMFYQGELKKAGIVEFLKLWAEPNPDPAPSSKKAGKKDQKQKKEKKEEKKQQAEPEEAATAVADEPKATSESTSKVIPISPVDSLNALTESCLTPKAHTCILAFVPTEGSADEETLVASLSALSTKYMNGKRQMFPFLLVPNNMEGVSGLKSSLGLEKDVQAVALSARKKWLRIYDGEFSESGIESWIDAIKMGEGDKKKLPAGLIVEATEAKAEPTETETASEGSYNGISPDSDAKTKAPEEQKHDEL